MLLWMAEWRMYSNQIHFPHSLRHCLCMCTNIYTVHTKCTFLKTQGIVCVCVWNPPTTHTTLSSKHKALFVGVYKHIHTCTLNALCSKPKALFVHMHKHIHPYTLRALCSKLKALFVGVYKHIHPCTLAELLQGEFKICSKVSYFLQI